MKLLIISDIHGDFECAKAAIEIFKKEKCDKLVILGDILYHGPRNDLPPAYAPKSVINLLNGYKEQILAVRGNCDTEVDQMVLEFPIMADYAIMYVDGLTIFATHGHKFNRQTTPPLCDGDILLYGHTHVLKCEKFGNNNIYINPGSISIPKENNPKTYLIYEEKTFTVKDFDGNVIINKEF